MTNNNAEFELRGLNHVAVVCKDMARTVDFYSNVLGMKLVKTIDLPGGVGQHFFFDMGAGQCFAFFWFAEAKDRVPGVSNPAKNINPEVVFTDPDSLTSSHGSMNHFAFDVPADKLEQYHQSLADKGVDVSPIMHHDTSPMQAAESVTDSVWLSSFYFQDPDGIVLEFATTQRPFSREKGDRWDHEPARPEDKEKYQEVARQMREAASA